MVKSQSVFNKIVSIDTLLSFDGIIPSLSEFQLNMVALIEKFHHVLLNEKQAQDSVEELCKIVCIYIDSRVLKSANGMFDSWQGYMLEHHFYGYEHENKDKPLIDQLSELINNSRNKVQHYAVQLLFMLQNLTGNDERIAEILARYSLTKASGPATDSKSVSTHRNIPFSQAIFIIGPYALKWFSDVQNHTAVRFDQGTVWLLAADTNEMQLKISRIKSEHPQTQIMAFFPLLPDGHDDISMLNSRLTGWYNSFCSLKLPEPLPLLFAFYGRFSKERIAHDPDRALWFGDYDVMSSSTTNFTEQINILKNQLIKNGSTHSYFATQRTAMMEVFCEWLDETGLTKAFQQMFTLLPLKLSGVMLSDHCCGFSRHGAWSRWLEEKYGVLPGLSSQLVLPTLPIIKTIGIPAQTNINNAKAFNIRAKKWRLLALAGAIGLLVIASLLVDKKLHNNYLPDLEGFKDLFGSQAAPDLKTLTIDNFPSGISELTPAQEQQLQSYLPQLEHSPENYFLLLGYSDNAGNTQQNLKLSQQRAQAVRTWLINHMALPEEHFTALGAGETNPVVSNKHLRNRAKNRRVEIIPLSTEQKR